MVDKVWITGAKGLIGSNLLKYLNQHTEATVFGTDRQQCNLENIDNIKKFIDTNKPNTIVHCAAKAGGIGANINDNYNFFYNNLVINSNLLHACYNSVVNKIILLSSVAVFPTVNILLTEENSLLDQPFLGDFGYGWSKRFLEIHAKCLAFEGKIDCINLILTNTFGENDNYNLLNGHCVPSLLHKIYLSMKNNTNLSVWGDGEAEREFIYVKDICFIISKILNMDKFPSKLICSTSKNTRIKDIINIMRRVSGFDKQIVFGENSLNGQQFRKTNNRLLLNTIPDMKFTDLETAIAISWKWMVDNYESIRK